MNKKPQKETEETGPDLILTFFKGNDGRTIARTNKGKICLLDIPYCRENNVYVKENEDWRCAIKEEKEKCLIVQPITRTLTADENAEIYGDKIDMLKNKFAGKGKART